MERQDHHVAFGQPGRETLIVSPFELGKLFYVFEALDPASSLGFFLLSLSFYCWLLLSDVSAS